MQGYIGSQPARDHLGGRFQAQHLLDSPGHQIGVVDELLPLRRVIRQQDGAVGDQVDGRIESGE